MRYSGPILGNLCLFFCFYDMLVYSKSVEEYVGHLKAVLEVLRQHQL